MKMKMQLTIKLADVTVYVKEAETDMGVSDSVND